MQPITILTYLLAIIILATILYKVGQAIKEAKSNDGKVSAVEMAGIALTLRKECLELVKIAFELKEKEKQGPEFIEKYVLEHLESIIDKSDVILPEEKEFLKKYGLKELAQSVIDMFIKEHINDVKEEPKKEEPETLTLGQEVKKEEIKEPKVEILPADKKAIIEVISSDKEVNNQ